jgi:sulfopyruvate decarboxylase TPP-binding subunit
MVHTLKQCSVTHLVWLPDTASGLLYETLRHDPDLKLVPVAREGETFGVALGLIVGGQRPVVCLQSTGLYESGDSIRGIWLELRLPLLALISYRGDEPVGPSQDSAATFLEPQLSAWGIPYAVVARNDEVVRTVPKLYRLSCERPGPAAALIAGEYGR